jgi:hypothetical protein
MLMGMSDHAYALDEPGVNTVKCPIHGRWLYRVFAGFVASKVVTMVTSRTQRAIASGLSEYSRPEEARSQKIVSVFRSPCIDTDNLMGRCETAAHAETPVNIGEY